MYLLELGVAPKRNSRATDESQAKTRSIPWQQPRFTLAGKIRPNSATLLAHMHAFCAVPSLETSWFSPCWQRLLDAK
jgi:hypothetical protein